MKGKGLPRSIFLVIVLVVLAIAIPLSGGCRPAAAPAPAPGVPPAEPIYHWRAQSAQYVQQVTDYQRPWADDLEAALGGRVKIDIYASGELMPYEQVFPAVQKGTLELGIGFTEAVGTVPTETAPFSSYVPFGYQSDLDVLTMWDYYGLDKPFIESWEALGGIKFLDCWTGDPAHIITNRPIEKIEDLQGLKLVSIPSVAEILKPLGVTVVDLPMEEFYLAGSTGVIDGLAGWCGATETYVNGYGEVFPYFLSQPVGVWLCYNFMNLDTWNSLPEDIQNTILLSMHDFRNRTLLYYWEGEKKYVRYETVTTLPEEDWAQIREIAESKWEEWAGDSAQCQRILAVLEEYKEVSGR